MNHAFLKINNLHKTYQTNDHIVYALNGVSLELQKGEIFGLLGVNGAGKTTLSSILATLHPPTSGEILYNGASIYNNLMGYRRILGFCPQKQNLDTFLTVEENLIYAGRYFLMPEDKIRSRLKTLMDKLELTPYAQFDVNALSGGNKQRVLIARALMHEPEIVILDEPTVGLDPDIRRKLWQQIRDLKKLGITVILTTHYLDEAEELSDRVCMLHKGKIILTETVASLRHKHAGARLEDIFVKCVKEQEDLP